MNFSIIGANANGLNAKKETFFNIINQLSPSVITVQETKMRTIGQIRIPGYQNFEKIRSNKAGGGLLTSVLEDLNPVLISTAKDDLEILTVEADLGPEKVRIINGYGPQEDDDTHLVLSFWQEFEAQIIQAKDDNCHILIQMDANAKVGSQVIKGDPHKMSNNGKLMLDIIERQNLIITNGLDTCKGTITRERTFENKSERSVIDYIVVCEKLLKHLLEIWIDEDKVHVLARHVKTRNGSKVIMSDHNTMYSKFSLTYGKKPRKIRKEYFQFKCEEGKQKFLEETSSNSKLSSCFGETDNFEKNANKFFKTLNGIFHKCFKKVRVRTGNERELGESKVQAKLKLKSQLKIFNKNNTCKIARQIVAEKLKEIDEAVAEEESDRNIKVVKEHINSIETLEGNFSQLGLWKLKQRLCPSNSDPPMAKHDEKGNLITAPETLKKLYLETYVKRLSHRDMKEDYLDIYFLKTDLWQSRLEIIKEVKTPPWKMADLEAVLKSLKNNKCMDPNGMINEVFKEGCIGSDLKEALLIMENEVKSKHIVPIFMALQDITTIYKNKGSRFDLNNDRGIFILTVMKKILDKLLYADNYEGIDENMSDCNVGSRKKRNMKDHLLIIHGIINSVVNGNEECIDIQIYDLEKAFDGLWLEDCLNDIYDNTPKDNQNDKLSLLYESNKDNFVAIKTAVGRTERVNIPTIVQQGGTWGPLLCSNSVDTVGKKCRDRGEHFYTYKKVTRVFPLAFVDDLNGIAKCGFESLALNTFLTTQIELKRLRFHVTDKKGKSKCHKMHVGKRNSFCPTLKVHGSVIQEVTEDTYLGDVLSADGRNTKNISERISKGLGIISQIFNLLDRISFGPHLIEIAVLLRNSMLVNGTLTNAEIWYNLSKSEIYEFEKLDILFFSKLFEVPGTTPHEAFFLELGILPVDAIIKARRINYLYSILKRDKSSMLYSFFVTQWNNPTKGDWTEEVKQDLEDFGITCSFEQILKKSKLSFKNLVKAKAQDYALDNLLKKQSKHSKMKNLTYRELKMQSYLSSEEIETSEKNTISMFRTRMERFGENFRGSQGPILCPLCQTHLDNQEMSYQCLEIRKRDGDKRRSM